MNQLLKGLRHLVDTLSETDRRLAPVCRINEALDVLELDGSRNASPRLHKLLKALDIKRKQRSYQKRSVAELRNSAMLQADGISAVSGATLVRSVQRVSVAWRRLVEAGAVGRVGGA